MQFAELPPDMDIEFDNPVWYRNIDSIGHFNRVPNHAQLPRMLARLITC
jgi:hypothetical protein